MGLLNGGNMPLVELGEQDVAEKSIGPTQRSVVEAIRPEELVLVRNVLVRSNGEKILLHDPYRCKVVLRRLPISNRRSVGRRFEGETLRYIVIDAKSRLSGGKVCRIGRARARKGSDRYRIGWRVCERVAVLIEESSARVVDDPVARRHRKHLGRCSSSQGLPYRLVVSEDERLVL